MDEDQAGLRRRDFFSGAGAFTVATLGAAAVAAQPVAGGPARSVAKADGLDLAMTHFAEVVRRFSDEFASLGAPGTEIDRAEGYRLFMRYLTIGIDASVQFGDPAFPAFYQATRDGVRKLAGDSPEQLYDKAAVSASYDYEITGNMRETELIEFTLYSGSLNSGSAKRRLIASLTDEHLVTDQDGNFTVRLNKSAKGPNQLPMADDASSLLVRRYLRDPWKDRPRPLIIRRTSGAPTLPALTSDQMSQAIEKAADFALWNVRTWAKWVTQDRDGKVNRFAGFNDTGDIYTPAGHRYLSGYWRLQSGEALLIGFVPPVGKYWSIVPMNFWMESLEWRFGNSVFASSFRNAPGKDGFVRLALAETNPNLPGVCWLETLGHNEGPISFRLARHHGPMPQVECKVIPVAKAGI